MLRNDAMKRKILHRLTFYSHQSHLQLSWERGQKQKKFMIFLRKRKRNRTMLIEGLTFYKI